MSPFLKKAKACRASLSPHYNCAQAVAASFSEAAGIDEKTALRFAAGFGGGMKRGSVCGAVTGGLMALGMFGVDDAATLQTFYRKFTEAHGDSLDCADLLRSSVQAGIPRKEHCDALVLESVALVEQILKEKGKLPGSEEQETR